MELFQPMIQRYEKMKCPSAGGSQAGTSEKMEGETLAEPSDSVNICRDVCMGSESTYGEPRKGFKGSGVSVAPLTPPSGDEFCDIFFSPKNCDILLMNFVLMTRC